MRPPPRAVIVGASLFSGGSRAPPDPADPQLLQMRLDPAGPAQPAAERRPGLSGPPGDEPPRRPDHAAPRPPPPSRARRPAHGAAAHRPPRPPPAHAAAPRPP